MNDSLLCIKLSSDICDRRKVTSLSHTHNHFYTLIKVFPRLRGSDSCFILSQTCSAEQAEEAAWPIIAVRKCGEHSISAVNDYWTEEAYGMKSSFAIVLFQVELHIDIMVCLCKTVWVSFFFLPSKVLFSDLDWMRTHTDKPGWVSSELKSWETQKVLKVFCWVLLFYY